MATSINMLQNVDVSQSTNTEREQPRAEHSTVAGVPEY